MPQQLRSLADRTRAIQKSAAITQQLLACGREDKATTDAIEQRHVELALEVTDLPGQSWLRRMQAQRRAGHRTELCDGDECSNVSKVHAPPLCRVGIGNQPNNILDA